MDKHISNRTFSKSFVSSTKEYNAPEFKRRREYNSKSPTSFFIPSLSKKKEEYRGTLMDKPIDNLPLPPPPYRTKTEEKNICSQRC